MKQISFLKILVQLIIVLSGISVFFGVPFVLISCVMPETIPFRINGIPAVEIPLFQKILMLVAIGGACCIVYAMILFKKTLELFEKKKVLHEEAIANLNKTGRFILIGYAIIGLCTIIASLSEGNISLNFSFILNSAFAIGLGLFFLVLSKVFRIAKNTKEENNLTL